MVSYGSDKHADMRKWVSTQAGGWPGAVGASGSVEGDGKPVDCSGDAEQGDEVFDLVGC